jgi:hypothetical protein
MIFSDDQPELKCPTCGYDLRGSSVEGDLFRCPECGAFTNIKAIVDEHGRRQDRQRQALWFGFFALVLVAAVTFAPRIEFIRRSFDGIGIFAVSALAFILWLSSLRWESAPWKFRLLFAVGGGLTVLLFASHGSHRLTMVPLLAWWIAFHIWAAARGYL